ncbi:MAG: PaaI family thioesterase [Lentisphaeria bacterium]|nr:PaaI family thioesterase [Lentisphaeria bacterium]
MISEKIKEFINTFDRFAAANNMRLTRVEPGYAEAELIITPQVLNGNNVVQGGAIFTLADLAFAGAANAENNGMVTQCCNLTFLRPGDGTKLTASARELNRGRMTGVYSVEVRNDRGKLVACGQLNGFATGKSLIGEQK